MNNLGNIFLSAHVVFATFIIGCFFMTLTVDDDELHQYAMNKAIRVSVIITILTLMGYSLYKLVSGSSVISINVIFFGIEGLSLLTLLLYYLELKGFSVSFKENKKIGEFLTTLSIIISVLTTISMLFEFKLFANPTGIIRYDVLILLINFLILPLAVPFFPNRNKALSRDDYKKEQKEIKKISNVFTVIYVIFMLLGIIYIIYRRLN
ncbi:hypothetical protein [Clostridium estertheticum]|uniref:hypothetical protein n=1 Tax=Clostridium estertheticum TaxID=238834 RepID=UPI001C7CAA19|nr:hypothetical protein [Clostridium estertheticum]MBX4263066.1 hypothetical protein [Clostridium estertheticum]MBX4271136.1 hypothetical protein [Clostridium estertheticum]WLC78370.1 hypothetical protein KTC98_14145 [Clostridium estertheticum]WLC89387.1 hypothetical protein KTC95_03940 [Clostridium estertheticum]